MKHILKKTLLSFTIISTISSCSSISSSLFSTSSFTFSSSNNTSSIDSSHGSNSTNTTSSSNLNTNTSQTTSSSITNTSLTTSSTSSSSFSSTTNNQGSIVFDNSLYDGYYSSIDFSMTNADLKSALCSLIYPHTDIGYKGLISAYEYTDTKEDGTIWDMYSNCTFQFTTDMSGGYKKEGDMYNREHTIPQSIFSKSAPMRSDLFHVYPTDGYVNNRRDNFPHAEVGNDTKYVSTNNTKVGTSITSGVSGNVCEPADEYKGDFARTYFYFVTCYEKQMSSFQSYAAFSQNSYPSLSKWAIKLYLQWSKDDPVSEKEINRNQVVYEKYQHNRNPFIDYPGLEDHIWSA